MVPLLKSRSFLLGALAAASLFVALAAVTGNIHWSQLLPADRHGTDAKGQSSDGTGASGHLATYNSGGGLTDGGTVLSACPTCVVASSPGAGFAHFAGGTQTVTSAALAAADIPASLSSTTTVNGTSIPSSVTLTQTIASGTSALGTSAIASGTCASAVTTSASGAATTDAISASFNADPTAVTGYIPTTSGMLTIIGYPTTNNVNWKVCNNSPASITPGAITINWRVVR